MIYVEWYGIFFNFVVFLVAEICVDYSGVYVFHVFFICASFTVLEIVLMSVV